MNRKPRRGRWSVKEFYALTEEQYQAARVGILPGEGVSTGGSCVHVPHLTRFGAWVAMQFLKLRGGEYGPMTQFKIVNHDEEMRAWRRFDFIDHPTEDDLARAAGDIHKIIPVIAPGESVIVKMDADGSFNVHGD